MKHFAHLFAITMLLLMAAAVSARAQDAPSPTPTPNAAAQDAPKPQEQDAPKQQTAAAPQETPAKPDYATVFIYRPKKLVGSALEPSVFCDGVELGRMDNGRYLVLKLAPGEHRVHMTDKSKRVEFKVGRGEAVYVRFRLEPGTWKGEGSVRLSNDEDALKELKKLKPLDPSKIKDRTLTIVEADKAAAELKRFSS